MPTNSTTKTTKNTKTNADNSAQKIAELEAMIKKLTEQQQFFQNGATEVQKEISLTRKTKLTSLTYGLLTLHHPSRGFLRFDKFGSTRTVTYAQLMDYVNNCKSAAEEGKFYIHDQDMVEELGLSEAYETLLSEKMFNKILTSETQDDNDADILRNASDSQKEVFVELTAQKVYTEEITDMNRVDFISKNLGVDILSKVREMKETSKILNETE